MEEKETKTTKKISFSEMRKEGRKISRGKSKARTFLLITLIIYGIFFALGIIDGIICEILGIEGDSIIPNLVTNILSIIFSIGVLSFTLDLINGIDAKVKNFWKGIIRDRIRKGVFGALLTGILVILGFLALIIPGIIVSVRLTFVLYAVIDKGLDPTEAIKYSWNITKGHFREIIGFNFYFLFYNIVGMLCLIIGLIRTGPMTQLATARYYKLLSEIYEENKKKNLSK